jgi:uncharacterized protein (TIGR02646 family)
MKHVTKAGVPHDYAAWRKRVKGTQDENYPDGLKNPLKGKLHDALICEQGYLCAYTMKRIFKENSHIEHIKPESLCRADCVGSDLDYENLVACFPREGMRRKYRYGAQERNNWWENDGAEFVTPLEVNCEKRFRFDLEGNIMAVNGYAAAIKTIKKLGLDHTTLTEDRRRVIHEFVFGDNGDAPLSVAKAKQSSVLICGTNNQGEFHEFCVAIRDALMQHLEDLAKLSRKRRFARKK